ncbi:hypothetical protein QAD02_006037 [Eretmocerus hayati]|uniref:Uncharacterized protein n=1 Tax=Eretmocerus hayati TaxID=131215 RepID=A0ACC2MZX4_9HYME|nr:hypothetical protein QAD02_006037 [Eretmocerus hayati]
MKTDSISDLIAMDLETGEDYFENYFEDSTKPWFHKKKLSRELIVTINRCRSNHYGLAAPLARVRVVRSPKCACDEYDGNLDHVIWQCPLFEEQRVKLIKSLRKIKLQLLMKTSSLLAEPNIAAFKFIVEFFNDCELLV